MLGSVRVRKAAAVVSIFRIAKGPMTVWRKYRAIEADLLVLKMEGFECRQRWSSVIDT